MYSITKYDLHLNIILDEMVDYVHNKISENKFIELSQD